MREKFINLTERIDASAAALAKRYSAERVHTPRTTIRRIRSMLKQRGRPRAQQLMKQPGLR